MTKIRVINYNGIVVYNEPAGDKNIEDCKMPNKYKDCEYIIVEKSYLPECEYGHQLYFDGETKLENLKCDTDWTVRLMPDFLLKKKKMEDLDNEIDTMLAEDSPNELEIFKKNRLLSKIKNTHSGQGNTDLELLKIAQADLAKSSKSKPTIESKLSAKIAELEGE